MRSGNGRHRRPRQAPAFFVAAGVTGAGIAMPLLGAGAAQASDGATWDRVAECESGGLWSSDSGNGYYGGLQLTQESWEQNGGLDFAERPDLASRSQQIAVAERILAAKGPRAWPGCAVTSGLGDASKHTPGKDSRRGERPTPEAPSDTTSDDASGSEKPDTDAPSERPDGRGDRGDQSGPSGEDDTPGTPDASDTPDAPDTADPSTPSDRSERSSGGKRSAKPSPSDTGRDDAARGDQDRRGGERATPGGKGTGKHRGAPDARERDRSAPDRSSRDSDGKDSKDGAEQGSDDYRVKTGDSLSAIAEDLGLDGGWTSLYDVNRDTVGTDPDLILPGQRLAL